MMALRDGGMAKIDIPNRHIVFEGARYPLHAGSLRDPERGEVRFTADETGTAFLVYEDGRLVSLGDMRLMD